jgi:mevalonate kinase
VPARMAAAYGKVILVGEHAVVYGIPAIAVGVGIAATASARIAAPSSLSIGIRRWALARHEPDATPEARAFDALLSSLVGPDAAVEVQAEVHLHQPSGVGLGASAAIGVALARAVSDALGRPSAERSAAELLAAAQAWENVFHGRASGIDAATSYHGGCLWFRRSAPPEPLRLKEPLQLAVAVAGPAVSTRLMVESVAAFKAAQPRRFEFLIESIHAVVHEVRVALLLGRVAEIGALLDENHRLISALGVSTPGLDAACQQARDAGALGAKLTGGGGGGCVLALTAAEGVEPVLAAWRARGLHCFAARVEAAAQR